MGDLQRGSYVHVRGQRVGAEDAGAPSGFAITRMLCGDEELQEVLLDVLDTPVSPELAASGGWRDLRRKQRIW